MIIFIYILIFLISVALAKRKFGRYINLISIFSIIWCFFGVLSTFGLFGLRIPHFLVHKYAWLFVSVFNISFLIFSNKRVKTNIMYNDIIPISVGRAFLLEGVTIVLAIPLFFKMFSVFFSTGSIVAVRNFYFSNEIFSSAIVDLILRQLPIAMMQGLLIYYIFVVFNQRQYKLLVFSLLNVGMITMLNGGRYALITLIYSTIILFYLKRDNVKEKTAKKFDRKIKLAILTLIIIMVLVTVIRGQSLIRSIVIYFAGSFSFLDLILRSPETFALNERLYGYLTFAAILEPILILLKVLGLTQIKVPQWYFNIYCQGFYNIGSEGNIIYFNNNTTILYYFLRDFGWFGIVIGGVLLGFFLAKTYNSYKKHNHFYQMLFVYLCCCMFNSVMTYQLFGITPILIVATLFLATRKTKYKIRIRTSGQKYAKNQ